MKIIFYAKKYEGESREETVIWFRDNELHNTKLKAVWTTLAIFCSCKYSEIIELGEHQELNKDDLHLKILNEGRQLKLKKVHKNFGFLKLRKKIAFEYWGDLNKAKEIIKNE